jgi:hypothetical protein
MSSLKEITAQYDSAKSRLKEYGIDLDSFVKDVAVRRKLLLDLKPLGIDFTRIHRVTDTNVVEKRDRIINLGQREITSFAAHDIGGRIYEESIRVSVKPKMKTDTMNEFLDISAGVKIIDYIILPLITANPSEPSVSMAFHSKHAEALPPLGLASCDEDTDLPPPGLTSTVEDFASENGLPLRIMEEGNANSSGLDEISLAVRLPESYRGECRFWVLLIMEAQETSKCLPFVGKRTSSTVHIITAYKFVANIVGEGMTSVLSTEARSFIPKSIKAYFDTPSVIVSLTRYQDFIPMTVFNILHKLGGEGLAHSQIPNTWYQDFLTYPRGSEPRKSAMKQFVANHSTKDKYSKFLVHLDLESLHQEEEMKNHDLIELSVSFHGVEMVTSIELGFLVKMSCSFIWRGSKEGRPTIQKNSILHLRPTRASISTLEKILNVWRPPVNSSLSPQGILPVFLDFTDAPNAFLDTFHLKMVVTDFNLSKERVVGNIQFDANPFGVGASHNFHILEKMAIQTFINKYVTPSTEEVKKNMKWRKLTDKEKIETLRRKCNTGLSLDKEDRLLMIILLLQGLKFHCRATRDQAESLFAKKAAVLFSIDTLLAELLHPGTPYALLKGQEALPLLLRQAEEHLYDRSEFIGGITNRHKCIENLKNLNKEQKEAVTFVAAFRSFIGCKIDFPSSQNARLSPYIIFGPPGTGKTRTIISSVDMIARTSSEFKILAVAPSEAAADVLCIRLRESIILGYNEEAKNFGGEDGSSNEVVLIRVNTFTRYENSVPVVLRRFCYVEGGEVMQFLQAEANYSAPDLNLLFARYARVIIVSTPTSSGMMWRGTLSPPGFDYIFIDESSQAMEPELLTPLTLLSKKDYSMIIIAGDPKQLVGESKNELSPSFMNCDSLMERLLKTEPYSTFDHPYKSSNKSEAKSDQISMGVFLTKNYRSHCDILKLPSKIFYDDKLEEYADRTITSSIVGDRSNENDPPRWILKLGKSMPTDCVGSGQSAVNFVNILATHAHQYGSPSFYNEGEIDAIVKVIEALIDGTRKELINPPLKVTDIGIICAFRAQVLMVRDRLRRMTYLGMNLSGINVGSVEDFQGQEVRVVIISTVLSSRPQMLNDVDNSSGRSAMGLLAHANKFNVAVTRGKSLCVVVGNANLLLTDAYWRQYIQMCYSLKGYWGHKAPLLDRGELKEDLLPPDTDLKEDGEGTKEEDIFEQFLLRDLLEEESDLTEKEGDTIVYPGRLTSGAFR